MMGCMDQAQHHLRAKGEFFKIGVTAKLRDPSLADAFGIGHTQGSPHKKDNS
jgi:hypothetical protein